MFLKRNILYIAIPSKHELFPRQNSNPINPSVADLEIVIHPQFWLNKENYAYTWGWLDYPTSNQLHDGLGQSGSFPSGRGCREFV